MISDLCMSSAVTIKELITEAFNLAKKKKEADV